MIFFKFHFLIVWTGFGGFMAAVGETGPSTLDVDAALILWFAVLLVVALLPIRDIER